MIPSFLSALGALTLAGSAFGLLLFLVKRIAGDRLGPFWGCYSWVAALFFFAVPIPALRVIRITPASPLPEGLPFTPAAGEAALLALNPLRQWIPAVLFLLWGLGFLAALGRLVRGRRRLMRLLMESASEASFSEASLLAERADALGLRRRPGLLHSSGASGPLVTGLLHPTVFLPEGSQPHLDLVLTHELTHIRFGDLWLKSAAAVLGCIHWFNPLWIFIRRDLSLSCELCCDCRVGRNLDNQGRLRYGKLLLGLPSPDTFPQTALAFAGPKDRLKRRLQLIMEPVSKSWRRRAAALLLLAAAAVPAALLSGRFSPWSVALEASAQGTAFSRQAVPLSQVILEEPERTASAPSGQEETEWTLVWPVEGESYISMGYDEYLSHPALDIAPADKNAQILAAAAGTVVSAEWDSVYGWHAVIDHGDFSTFYAHCSSLSVEEGDPVDAGQAIAAAGKTGRATGVHLHFELSQGGEQLDPMATVSWVTQEEKQPLSACGDGASAQNLCP